MESYNAVTWLLDRNIEEGRGNKLAYTDTVSEHSYAELQRETSRAANLLRRLGVRREERVAMIMLDTVDFPIVFLGALRAGVGRSEFNSVVAPTDIGKVSALPRPYAKNNFAAEKHTSSSRMPSTCLA